jgi:hypothetical protein
VETPFVIAQLQQMSESYRLVITLTVQIITVLVLANVTLVGYAMGRSLAGILLIGPIFPLGIITTVYVAGRMGLPLIYTYINLERKYGHDQADWLGRSFFSVFINHRWVERALKIGELPDWSQRFAEMRRLPLPVVGTGKGIIRACLGLVALGQVAAAFILWGFFDWDMF